MVGLPGHLKRRDQVTIDHGNIFRLWTDKGRNTVEFVETLRMKTMNDSGKTSMDVSERSKSAAVCDYFICYI